MKKATKQSYARKLKKYSDILIFSFLSFVQIIWENVDFVDFLKYIVYPHWVPFNDRKGPLVLSDCLSPFCYYTLGMRLNFEKRAPLRFPQIKPQASNLAASSQEFQLSLPIPFLLICTLKHTKREKGRVTTISILK